MTAGFFIDILTQRNLQERKYILYEDYFNVKIQHLSCALTPDKLKGTMFYIIKCTSIEPWVIG